MRVIVYLRQIHSLNNKNTMKICDIPPSLRMPLKPSMPLLSLISPSHHLQELATLLNFVLFIPRLSLELLSHVFTSITTNQ